MARTTPTRKPATRPETVVVLDLAAIDLCASPTGVTATLTATGEFLGSRASGRHEPPRVGVARLLEEVLATTRLWRDGGWRRVVLYNPHTARMSVGASTGSTTLWAGGPLPVAAEGTVASLTGDSLVVDGHTAAPEDVDREAIDRALTAQVA